MIEDFSPRIRTLAALIPAFLLMAGCAGYPYPPHANELLAKSDRKLLVETAQSALEKNKTGQSANWSNPETNARGTVTPTQTYERAAISPCRNYRVTVTIREKTHEAADTACRQSPGNWKSVNHPGLAGQHVFEGLDYYFTGGRYLYDFPRYEYHDPFDDYPRLYPRVHFGFGYRHYKRRWR